MNRLSTAATTATAQAARPKRCEMNWRLTPGICFATVFAAGQVVVADRNPGSTHMHKTSRTVGQSTGIMTGEPLSLPPAGCSASPKFSAILIRLFNRCNTH